MLLLDENLPRWLILSLKGVFPGIAHILDLGLMSATDIEIWDAARQQGLAIVSKDDDFRQLSLLHGHPPKVIWLRIGNASTAQVEQCLIEAVDSITAFVGSPDESLLIVDGRGA